MSNAAGGLLVTLMIPACVMLVFGGAGAAAILFGLRRRRKAEASQTWPSVMATVQSASVRRQTRAQDDAEGDLDISYSYEPVVEYQYSYAGQMRTGRRLSFGALTYSTEARAQAALNRYRPGAVVTARCNPDNPDEATLETSPGGAGLFILTGLFFIGAAACSCCAALPGAYVFGQALLHAE